MKHGNMTLNVKPQEVMKVGNEPFRRRTKKKAGTKGQKNVIEDLMKSRHIGNFINLTVVALARDGSTDIIGCFILWYNPQMSGAYINF